MLVPQVPQMWHKCGTKKGPHTFLDDLGIMHLGEQPWSKSAQICGRFKSSAQIGR